MEQTSATGYWLWFVVEIAKALAWPGAFSFFVWIGWPVLRDLIRSLVSRNIDIEAYGVKAKIAASEQQHANDRKPAIERNLTPVPSSPRPAVADIESTLRRQIATMQQDEAVTILVRNLAETRLQAGHEFVYNRIFGSQIVGLRRLSEMGTTTVEAARQFFVPYAEAHPEVYATYGFEGWLGFLVSSFLVTRTGEALQITEFGRDFLRYLNDARLIEPRPF